LVQYNKYLTVNAASVLASYHYIIWWCYNSFKCY